MNDTVKIIMRNQTWMLTSEINKNRQMSSAQPVLQFYKWWKFGSPINGALPTPTAMSCNNGFYPTI